jgi:hypothetical protein
VDTQALAEALMVLAARPFDSQIVRDLAVRHAEMARLTDGHLVGLDLRRAIHVAVAAVPELLARMPLTDVRELV